jgi:hypothetical protein
MAAINTNLTPTVADLDGSSEIVLAENESRQYAYFCNVSDVNVTLNFGAAAVDAQGVLLLPNGVGVYEMTRDKGNLDIRDVHAINASGSNKNLVVIEG